MIRKSRTEDRGCYTSQCNARSFLYFQVFVVLDKSEPKTTAQTGLAVRYGDIKARNIRKNMFALTFNENGPRRFVHLCFCFVCYLISIKYKL